MSRLSFLLKLASMAAVYCGLVAAVISWPSRTSGEDVGLIMWAEYGLAVILLPNALTFFVSAILLRRRWADLRIPQIMAAGSIAAIATFAMVGVFVFLYYPFLGDSTWKARTVAGLLMLLPGIIAAQLLRVGGNRNRSPRMA